MPAKGDESTSEELLPLSLKYLPDRFKEKAERELNETPERRTTALEELKEMARGHKLTCGIDYVDDFLVQFLRHRKYDVPRAFRQLVNFTRFMNSHSSFFLSVRDDIFDVHFRDPRRHFCNVISRRCPDGCLVMLVELGKWDPEIVSLQELWQMAAMFVSQCSRDPMTQINGFKLIYDFKGASLKQARYCTPSNLYLIYHGGIECFPCRYKEIHLVSENFMMKAAWTIGKTLISKKLKERIIVSSSRRDLLDHFPPSVLPLEYGGVLEDYYTTEWMKEANRQQEGFTLEGQSNCY